MAGLNAHWKSSLTHSEKILDSARFLMKSDVVFLSELPSIKKILQISESSPSELQEKPAVKGLVQESAAIFKQYMARDQQITQIRLIGLAHRGKELIRVDRVQGKTVAMIV